MTDNFKFIYKILRTLEAAMDYSEYDFTCISHDALGITRERWNAYIEMMLDAGYIKGATIRRDVTGSIMTDIQQMRITLKGLEYLSENSIMQRMYNTAKGIVDLIP